MGHVVRPSDHKEPKKIAWLQCVGSRDIHHCDHAYCSAVCCMYAIKEAVIAKEHAGKELEAAIFFMDMRTHGKDFEKYYNRAKEEHGVRFIRSRVHSLEEVPGSGGDVEIVYVSESGELVREVFDLVVLSVGLEISREAMKAAERLGIHLDRNGFAVTNIMNPVETSRPGVYVCGAFNGPKDIPQSVVEASAAAAAATAPLASARHTMTRVVEPPQERDVSLESPRIGVFVCRCGINIGGVVDIPAVVHYAESLPNVVYAEENLFTCSQDTQQRMSQVIRERRLNRVVVAACSPRTHEGLFQETLVQAGLNKYLVEMANLRNLDSWVHSDDPTAATAKAKDMVRMAVSKARLLAPLRQTQVSVVPAALVVGGGVAGMTAALTIADHGFGVHLLERSPALGGNALRLHETWTGEAVEPFVKRLVNAVENHQRITVHRNAVLCAVDGFVGNFKSTVRENGKEVGVEHGVAVIAIGARESFPKEYLFGEHPAVVTSLGMDALLSQSQARLKEGRAVAFIQCVGSRTPERPYCSRVCCTHSVRSALSLKTLNPEMDVFILYRDMRTYGQREDLFRRAREAGVLFIRYDLSAKPKVVPAGDRVRLEVDDPILRRPLALEVDFLCLATAIESHWDEELARLFKIPLDADGWFLEAHQKLRPVDFAVDGVFLCGMAHYPKPLDESIAQAQGAAARALTILSRNTLVLPGVVSWIDARRCVGCGMCVTVCPFGAIRIKEEAGTAEVVEALCKGCGACAAVCPAEAAVLQGFSHAQLYAQIRSALAA
jgi:heterodisulfide reductase subunit A-like polyferredoxin